MSLRRRLGRRFPDLVLAASTALTMVRVRVVLARGGLPAALRRLRLEAVPAGEGPPQVGAWDADAQHRARVAGRVLELPLLRSSCLPTSLSLAQVLRRHAVSADVVIGVSATEGFSAHAWVELGEGRIDLSGYPLDAHREISRLRPPGATT